MAKKGNENQEQNKRYLSEGKRQEVLAKPAELTLPTTDDNSAAAVGIETSLPELNNIQPVVKESTLKQPSAPSLLKQKAQKSRDKRNAKTVIPVTTKSEPERSSANVNWGDVIYNKMGVTPEIGVKSSVNLSDLMKDKLDGKSTSFLTTKGPATSTNVYAGNPNSNISTNISAGEQIPTGSTTVIEEAKAKTPETTEKKEEAKLSPWEEMLKERRKTLMQDKTDAAKMQKYYALTDALKALGDMGGTALGSAIGGGKALDNATPVAEYKPSRGYLDAFEKAKNANEALRKLDDTEFQLKYKEQLIADEQEFKLKVDQLDKQWQKDMIDYKSKIEKAAAENNLALKAKYEAEAAALTQKYWKDRAKITHGYTMEEKKVGNETIQNQYKLYNTVPIGFKNGTGITVPKPYYDDMLQFFIDEEKGIDKDNVGAYIRNHPDEVNAYLKMFGLAGGATAPVAPTTANIGEQYPFPYHISQIPAGQMTTAPTLITVPEETTQQASNNTEIDYSQYKQQK